MRENRETLAMLLEDSRTYWASAHVGELTAAPDALTFLRDYVAQSVPFVIRGGAITWPAISLWAPQYLRKTDVSLTVALTPDGRADSVRDGRFALPLVETWSLGRLVESLIHPNDDDVVPYYSAQNSCLTEEAGVLRDDVDFTTVQFARDALGSQETAVNLWIGDGRSVSTMHADPFHNLYVVVRGRKSFSLRPPSDAAFIPKPTWPNARWKKDASGMWKLCDVEDGNKTRWIPSDIHLPGKPMVVDLEPGDILYMPPLWCT